MLVKQPLRFLREDVKRDMTPLKSSRFTSSRFTPHISRFYNIFHIQFDELWGDGESPADQRSLYNLLYHLCRVPGAGMESPLLGQLLQALLHCVYDVVARVSPNLDEETALRFHKDFLSLGVAPDSSVPNGEPHPSAVRA